MKNTQRFHRWINASFYTAQFDKFMPITVQGLGHIDHDLVFNDAKVLEKGITAYPSNETEAVELNHHITLSYLWVLGSYEVIRSMHQKIDKTSYAAASIGKLKTQFARLRVPLAKFEPAEKYKKTDSRIAYPTLNSDHGISWQVAENIFISRQSLSDAFLSLLEELRTKQEQV